MATVMQKTVVTLSILVALAVAVSGCTVQNPISTPTPTNKAVDYANAFVNNTRTDPGKNMTVVDAKVIANGTDGARITMTEKNSTKTAFANGSTTTSALNIKQFASTADATTFYDNISFGYTTENQTQQTPIKTTSPYKQVMGHDPTVHAYSYKFDSLSFISAQASLAAQTDEFVLWGTISVVNV
ncbi:MAG: hypothetical protein ACXVIG_03615 [Halobacteriota archaeon]